MNLLQIIKVFGLGDKTPIELTRVRNWQPGAKNERAKPMEIFEYAMQMEKDGEALYRKLAKETRNKGLKTILTTLADEEVKHYQAIEQIKTSSATIADTTILNDSKNVFSEMAESSQNVDLNTEQIELYKMAQDLEEKSEQFYTEKSEQVQNQDQKELFLTLAEQERKHYFLLENIIELVSRPKTWLENAEFYHLNEY